MNPQGRSWRDRFRRRRAPADPHHTANLLVSTFVSRTISVYCTGQPHRIITVVEVVYNAGLCPLVLTCFTVFPEAILTSECSRLIDWKRHGVFFAAVAAFEWETLGFIAHHIHHQYDCNRLPSLLWVHMKSQSSQYNLPSALRAVTTRLYALAMRHHVRCLRDNR